MQRKTQRIGILIFLFAKIVIGIWDLVTDIIYVWKAQFQLEYVRYLMIFFIVITPFIMLITWSVTLGKIKLDRRKDIEKERRIQEQYLANSESIIQFLYRFTKVSLQENYLILRQSLNQVFVAFIITLLQTLKVFPFFLIAYTFKKFEVVITPELLKYAAQQTSFYKNLLRQEQQESDSTEDQGNAHGSIAVYQQLHAKLYALVTILFFNLFFYFVVKEWTKSNGSLNWFFILSFVSSVGSVFYNIFILSHWMFDSEIRSFFDLLTCMMDSQKGRKEEKVQKVFSFFDIPQKVLIINQSQLQKMGQLKPDRFQRIKQLHIHLPKNKNSFNIILTDMHTILRNLIHQKIKLNCFSLNLSECNMTNEERFQLSQQVRKIKAESKYLNLKQTPGDTQQSFCDSIIERVLNMNINSNFFYFAEDFTLYRVCKLNKMNEIYNFLNANKIKTLRLDDTITNNKFYVNIQEEQLYSNECLKNLLVEKEESVIQLQIKLHSFTYNYNFIEGYQLLFPLYLDSFFYLQINSPESMNFQQSTNILINNLKQSSYQNGIVIHANFQYNQSASLLDVLKYFMSLYKLEQNQETQIIQVEEEIGSKNFIDQEDLELISPFNQENDMVVLEFNQSINNQFQPNQSVNNQIQPNQSINNQVQPQKPSVLQSMMIKEDTSNPIGMNNLNNQILFQIIKIDDCILIGSSKALFHEDQFLNYLISEEGNYSCLFIFLDFEISQEFLLKLQAQLLEYFKQMNNLRHLHMIIGESGSFYIDLQLHFTFIENVLIFQNELFQFKFTKTEKDSLITTQQTQLYTYVDLVSEDFNKQLQLISNNEYAQQVLMNARKGLDINKNLIQKDLQNILSQNNLDLEQIDNKFQTCSYSFNSKEICLPLQLPPLSQKLLPQSLKQMNKIQNISIYDNIGIDIQEFIHQNSLTIQSLKVLNSKIEKCNCGLKHQSKNQNDQKNSCSSYQNMMILDKIIYRINTIQIIDIQMLKDLKYLNITQSQMYLSSDYQHFVSCLQNLNNKLQVVKLSFQSCNIWFNNTITEFICNSFILQTFQINAVDSYNLIGLDCILKGLSFNFLVSNIGIKINSNQITQKDMDLIEEILQKRRNKGSLKSFKFSIKKSMKDNKTIQSNVKELLVFYNKMMAHLIQIPNINKINLCFKNFNAIINYADLPNLGLLLFQKPYKKMKININGNINQYTIISQQLLQQINSQQQQLDNTQFKSIIFKSDMICKQIMKNNIFNAVFSSSANKKILTIPYDLLENTVQDSFIIKGQHIFLKIESDLNMDMIYKVSFENNLNQLILDFSKNIYLLFDDLQNLLNNLILQNKNLKYLCIKTPNQLLTQSQSIQIKQLFKNFQHYQPKQFILN